MPSLKTYTTLTISPKTFESHSWWPQLHSMIIDSFLTKTHSVFPPTWTRLDPDPIKGAQGLAKELGDRGLFIVIFDEDGQPAACSGVLPFRGENWINDVESSSDAEVANRGIARPATDDSSTTPSRADEVVDWETCCFCVHPSQRGQGLARRLLDQLVTLLKPHGAKRLVSNYAVDETGDFWTKLGFEVIPGAGGMLPKGFQTDPEKEGLRADVYFKMGAKRI